MKRAALAAALAVIAGGVVEAGWIAVGGSALGALLALGLAIAAAPALALLGVLLAALPRSEPPVVRVHAAAIAAILLGVGEALVVAALVAGHRDVALIAVTAGAT